MKTRIVAELSANHGHNLEIALATVRAAADAGADAIKIQTYTADTITLDSTHESFQIHGTLWDGRTLYDLYQEAYTPWEWHAALQEEALRNGLEFFSTPFDPTAIEFLEELHVPCYKIASFEINDLPLIALAASKAKPMILSTGLATFGEIQEAVLTCRNAGCTDITLLKCTSSYPAPMDEANLLTIPNMAQTFGTKVGLSDHTEGMVAALGAVALGACMIEKHFILDRSIGGPDASFSMEPKEFKEMARSIRQLELALGHVEYEPTPKARENFAFRRSLYACQDIAEGEPLSATNIRSIRPSYGLPPALLPSLIGKTARIAIPKGTPLAHGMWTP